MATVAIVRTLDEQNAALILREAGEKLTKADGEVVVDFSSVRRLDVDALQALESLANAADEKSVSVVLRSVNVGVYKVLKLVELTSRFSFVN